MADGERIVAVGLLTQSDLAALGSAFHRAYKIDETPCFGELLRAIDEADRTMRTGRTGALDGSKVARRGR